MAILLPVSSQKLREVILGTPVFKNRRADEKFKKYVLDFLEKELIRGEEYFDALEIINAFFKLKDKIIQDYSLKQVTYLEGVIRILNAVTDFNKLPIEDKIIP